MRSNSFRNCNFYIKTVNLVEIIYQIIIYDHTQFGLLSFKVKFVLSHFSFLILMKHILELVLTKC